MSAALLLVALGRDGTSALLEFWSPRWELWTLAPTFIMHATPIALLHTAWWLAIAGGAGWFLSRQKTTTPGRAALTAMVTLGAALLIIAVSFPLLPAGEALPRVDLGARSRLATLDEFDERVRPVGVIYDPVRKVNAAAVLSQVRLGVKPQQRTDWQPLPVIHNGRFSLPAGSYGVDVTFGGQVPAGPTPFSLQVGRIGPPLQSWTLQPVAGQTWHTNFDLALDAGFVGFRGPVEMERAITAITITPTSVVDAGARPRMGEVLSVGRYGDAAFYFYDQAYAEPNGFWTAGRRASDLAIAVPPARTTPVVLFIHSGGVANHVTITTLGWRREFDLVPGQGAEVELPVVASGVMPLTIATSTGFSPSQFDPASKDLRFLGIWVEVQNRVKPPS